ncbi:hypothetical protein ACFLSW_00265 [Candidatus Bipolaricaulota bacterium]
MKIATCTMQMVTLIFLLFWSFNGGYSYLNSSSGTDLVSRPTTELVSAWGTPDDIVVSTDLGLASSQLSEVEIWSYDNPARSVVVRDNLVISIRFG